MKNLLCLTTIVLVSSACASTTADFAAADPEEASIRNAVLATYEVISGPPGPRDWKRMKELFAPAARLIPVGKNGPRVLTTEEYIEQSKTFFDQNGFFERPVFTSIARYGNIAHVISTYESRHDPSDAAPFARGLNSFQLGSSANEWRVITILWQPETAANPIPAKYPAEIRENDRTLPQ